MFRKIKDLFTPDRVVETVEGFVPPYGLTEGEWNALKVFHNAEEWDMFLQMLDGIVKFNAETLLTTKSSEDLHFLRGFIAGVRKAGSIIEEQEHRETSFILEKRRRDNVREPDRTAALFGSPAWRSQHN